MISKYVSLEEVTKSQTAIKNGVSNMPNAEQLERIKLLATKVFDPLREWAGGAIKISSGFRSAALNKLVGGSNTSQHSANNGAAFDLDDDFKHKTNKEVFEYIKEHLDFDQLIYEFGTDNNPDWVHVSYVSPEKNRKQVLRAVKQGGKTVYQKY